MKAQTLFAFTLALLSMSFAASANERGQGFIRAEVGRSNFEMELNWDLRDEDDTPYGLRGGYFFTRYFAVEGFYMRYGEVSYTVESTGFYVTRRMKLDGYGLGVVAKKSVGEAGLGWFVDARAGAIRTGMELRAVGCIRGGQCEPFGEDHSSTNPYMGVGVGYDFSPYFGLGLNYDRVKGELFGDERGVTLTPQDVTLTSLTLSAEYRF